VTITLSTFKATRGNLQSYGDPSAVLKVMVLDETVIDNEDELVVKVTDLSSEVTGGTYAATTLTGVDWDLTGDQPALRADDVTIEGLDLPGPSPLPRYYVVFCDDHDDSDRIDDLIAILEATPAVVVGDQPISWPGGIIATIEQGEGDADARLDLIEAWTVAGVPFVDGDVDAEDLAAALALGDLSDTDTDGVNAGDSLVFDGATWVPAASSSEPAARRLGAAWCIDSRSAVGTSVWADQGRAGVDMVNTGRGAAVVQPGSFTGLRPYGSFNSAVGAVWPTLLDVRWKGKVRRQRRDPANEWIEALLATIDGDEDWLEPAYVNGPDGWFLGLDLRLDGEDSEREFLGTTPIDPDQDWCWRFVMDGTDVVLYRKAFSADLLGHTGWTELEREAVTDLPMTDPGSETAGPYTVAAPPEGTLLGVSFTGALVAEAVILDDVDGDPLHHFRASDGAEGATTVTTSGETWTAAVGLLSVAPDNPTMTSSDTGWGAVDPATFDIDSDQSVTWAWRGRPWPVGGSGSTLVVGDNALAMFISGAAGWGFASAPGFGIDWAFLISDGSGTVTADAGAAPTGYVTVAAVLDRSDDTVRLYIDTELVATADGSSLGAIASTGVEQGYSDLEWVAMWPRALDVDELAYLQGSI